MTLMRRTSPFSELVTLRQAMDRPFDDTVFRPLGRYLGNGELCRLPLDVRTTPDALFVAADKAEATFEHGVLTLRITQAEQVKPRQIQIRPITTGSASAVEPGHAGGHAGDKG